LALTRLLGRIRVHARRVRFDSRRVRFITQSVAIYGALILRWSRSRESHAFVASNIGNLRTVDESDILRAYYDYAPRPVSAYPASE
jgi:hypothetical protein